MAGFGQDPIPGIPRPANSAVQPSTKAVMDSVALCLRVSNGPCEGRTFPLNESRTRVGRSDPPAVTVDIDLTDCELGSPAMISRVHAELIWIDGRLNVVDLGSRNGTWVAEQPVRAGALGASDPVPVAANTRIRFANLELEIIGTKDSAGLA